MDETTAQELAREFAALNTATERAHQAIAELKQARADLRAERLLVEQLLAGISAFTSRRVQELIEAELKVQFEALMPMVKKLLDQSVAHVSKKFDDFSDILMGAKIPGQEDLETLINEKVLRNGPMPTSRAERRRRR